MKWQENVKIYKNTMIPNGKTQLDIQIPVIHNFRLEWNNQTDPKGNW